MSTLEEPFTCEESCVVGVEIIAYNVKYVHSYMILRQGSSPLLAADSSVRLSRRTASNSENDAVHSFAPPFIGTVASEIIRRSAIKMAPVLTTQSSLVPKLVLPPIN